MHAQRLQAMDNSHVALVSLHLEKEAFGEFRCDRDMTLGMNLASLQKIIKCANNDDSCKITANEDADNLTLTFQGKRGRHRSSDRCRLSACCTIG